MPLILWHNVHMGTLAAISASHHTLLAGLEVSQLNSGLPLEVLSDFVASSGLPSAAIYAVVIPLRTLKHRRAKHQALSRDESDKLVRLMKAFDHTVRVFGNQDKALSWLEKPRDRFDGLRPLDMLQTEFGGSKVDEMLWQIADGMFV